jgi:hypothetical protein
MRLSVQRMASKRQPFHSINRHVSFGRHGELDPDLHLETLEFFPRRPWTGFHGPCIQLASIDFEGSREPEVGSQEQAGGRKILTSVFRLLAPES